MKSSTYVGVLLLSLGMGCGSGGSSSIPIGSLGSEFSDAACDFFSTCPLPGIGSATFSVLSENPGSAGTCGDVFAASFGGFEALEAAVARGTLIYDGEAASQCLSAMSRRCVPPQALLGVEPDCLDVFTGTVEPGSACLLDEECAQGARCFSMSDACGGVCVLPVGLGGNCADDSECSAELGGTMECTATAANAVDHCVITRYVAVAAGDQCGEIDADGDERVSAYCGAGTYCRTTLGSDLGTCSNPLAVGAPCNIILDACASGAACGGLDTTTCRAVTVIDQANVACDDRALIICNPLDRLECVDSVCAVVGDGTLGASCRDAFGTDCNAGLYCAPDLAGSTCETLVATGQPCGFAGDASCASRYCDETDPSSPVCATSLCF